MTAQRRTGTDSPFEQWCRNEARLDSHVHRMSVIDSDRWFHQYRSRQDKDKRVDSLMLVELKNLNERVTFSQLDTLKIIDKVLRTATSDEFGRLQPRAMNVDGEIRHVVAYGAFVLRMSGMTPDDSHVIEWDGVRVSRDTLVEILNFERDPRQPMRLAA